MPDLMAALEASIAAAKSRRRSRPSRPKAPAKSRTGQRRTRAVSSALAAKAKSRAGVRTADRGRGEGRRLSLSNLDKVLYPEPGFTKGQVIDYYTRIAPVCCRTCAAGR